MKVAGEDWANLLATFKRSAWRYECQGEYHEPDEAEPFRKFLTGEPDDMAWLQPWLASVRRATTEGRTFGRVRVLTDPLTDYLRWELQVGRLNEQAGEDIRVLHADTAAALDLPTEDFWLFDDTTAALMRFDSHGFDHAEVYTVRDNPDLVQRCRDIQARAMRQAIPLARVDDLLRSP